MNFLANIFFSCFLSFLPFFFVSCLSNCFTFDCSSFLFFHTPPPFHVCVIVVFVFEPSAWLNFLILYFGIVGWVFVVVYLEGRRNIPRRKGLGKTKQIATINWQTQVKEGTFQGEQKGNGIIKSPRTVSLSFEVGSFKRISFISLMPFGF